MYYEASLSLTKLLHTLTKADQVPNTGLWGGAENPVDQPEGVDNFNAHPGERGEQGVMEACRHPSTHTLPSHIGQDPSKEEKQVEEGQRDCQTKVDWYGPLLLGSLATKTVEWKFI